MDESRLCMIEQIEQFLSASALVAFSPPAGDCERYGHISGVLLRYLRHTSGYSRPQVTRLVAQWGKNRLATAPLAKRYCAPGIWVHLVVTDACSLLRSHLLWLQCALGGIRWRSGIRHLRFLILTCSRSTIRERQLRANGRCSGCRNHRHIADRRPVNANVGFGAISSENRMSLLSLNRTSVRAI